MPEARIKRLSEIDRWRYLVNGGLSRPVGQKYLAWDASYATPQIAAGIGVGGRTRSGDIQYNQHFFTNPDYYLSQAGYDLLDQNIEYLASLIRSNVRIVEYGPAEGKKTRHLLEAIQKIAGPLTNVEYIAVDEVMAYANQAAANVKEVLGEGSTTKAIIENFCDAKKLWNQRIGHKPGIQTIIFWFGFTWANLRPEQSGNFPRDLSRYADPGTIILMDTDETSSRIVLDPAYANEHVLTFALNTLLYWTKLENLSGLDYKQFKQGSQFDENTYVYQTYLESQKQQIIRANNTFEFDIGVFTFATHGNSPLVVFEEGERIPYYYGRKAPAQVLQSEFESYGHQTLNSMPGINKNKAVRTHLLAFRTPQTQYTA